MNARKSAQIVKIGLGEERTGIDLVGFEQPFFCDTYRIASSLTELGCPVNNRYMQELFQIAEELKMYPTLQYENVTLHAKGTTYEKADGSKQVRNSDSLEFEKFSVYIPLKLLGETNKRFVEAGFALSSLNSIYTVEQVKAEKIEIKQRVAVSRANALAALAAKVGEKA